MQAGGDTTTYFIMGVDDVLYGPVDLPTLVDWVQDERVTPDTWIHLRHVDTWHKAREVNELQALFKPGAVARPAGAQVAAEDGTTRKFKPGSLRRVKILAEMTDEQLERFASFMELQEIRQWAEIVRQGSPGDAMYLILQGEARVRLMISGKETILVTLSAGEFFGEVALFDHGPRSADVVANSDCLLLKISAGAFQTLIQEASDLAARFLFGISKTLIARIRADNKRYRDTIAFARAMGQ